LLATSLALLATLLLGALRYLEREKASPRPQASAPISAPETSLRSRPGSEAGRISLGDPGLEAQLGQVIDSFDRTGRPPAGVTQGGRRGGPRGVFDNAQGKLPTQAPGYYRESDVWPRAAAGRGAQRLIFGKAGEAYYTADHYRTFVRLR
jgi:guanyl-specific ribonuclease Sa